MLTKLQPGEYGICPPDEGLTTVLGSCVAACVRDPAAAVGGMNHFLLPCDSGSGIWDTGPLGLAARYGDVAMERLINEIVKQGGRRSHLEVKLFGGAAMGTVGGGRIGQSNISFALEFLAREGIPVASRHVGGTRGRKLVYFPGTGRALMQKLPPIELVSVQAAEARYARQLQEQPVAGEVELF